MPTNEPLQNFQVPALGDSPNVPKWIADIVRDLIGISIPRYVSEAARDLAIPTPQDGQRCITGSSPNTREWMGQGGQWTETFPLYGDWTTLPPATGWEPFDGNSWWARQEGEWAATNNVLLRRVSGSNFTLNAGTLYNIGGVIPSHLLPANGIYGPYVPVVIAAGTTRVLGMLFWNTTAGSFYITAASTVTLTGGSGSHYIAVPSLRWLLKTPTL